MLSSPLCGPPARAGFGILPSVFPAVRVGPWAAVMVALNLNGCDKHKTEPVAEAAKLDAKHWREIEAGRINVTVATLMADSQTLRVKLAVLFDGVW